MLFFAGGLKQLLLNFSIWKLLLSRKWLNAQGAVKTLLQDVDLMRKISESVG